MRETTIEEAKNKVVQLANSQVGYREGTNNYNKYADDPKITQLYGWCPQNQPWCCVFANWVYLNALGYDIGSRLTYGGTAACSASADLFKAAGAFVHFPEVGDQAFYYSGGGINHTGIVVAVDGTVFTAIEGNYSDKVSSVRHNIGSSDIAGFGRPNWKIISGAKDSGTVIVTKPASPAAEEPSHEWKPQLLSMSNSYKDDCVTLQALLNSRHFACGSADGFFGAKTQAAVNRFQAWAGLEVDGVCGPATWKKLLEVG